MDIFTVNISITIFKVFMSCVLAYRKLIIIPKKSFLHITSGTSRGSWRLEVVLRAVGILGGPMSPGGPRGSRHPRTGSYFSTKLNTQLMVFFTLFNAGGNKRTYILKKNLEVLVKGLL